MRKPNRRNKINNILIIIELVLSIIIPILITLYLLTQNNK
jgi:hypothetical protein